MSRVFVLARVGYDEFTIVGIYDSQEKADAAREQAEEALVATGDRKRRRSRNVDQHDELTVLEFTVNKTRIEYIVRLRRDGQVVERHAFLGYGDERSRYERLYEGRGDSFESAEALARRELSSEAEGRGPQA